MNIELLRTPGFNRFNSLMNSTFFIKLVEFSVSTNSTVRLIQYFKNLDKYL